MPINSWVINRSHLRAYYRTSVKQTTTYPARFVNPLLVYLSWSSQSTGCGKCSRHGQNVHKSILTHSLYTGQWLSHPINLLRLFTRVLLQLQVRIKAYVNDRYSLHFLKGVWPNKLNSNLLGGFSCWLFGWSSVSATPKSILLPLWCPLLYFCFILQLTDTNEGWIIS